MDPITVIVSAIASGAAAGIKETATSAVKDAYAAVRRLIADRYAEIDLDPVERRPESEAKRASLGEDLEAAGAQDDGDLLEAARQLIAVLREHDTAAAEIVGVDLARVEAAALTLKSVRSSGSGLRVQDSRFAGNITIGHVESGRLDKRHPPVR